VGKSGFPSSAPCVPQSLQTKENLDPPSPFCTAQPHDRQNNTPRYGIISHKTPHHYFIGQSKTYKLYNKCKTQEVSCRHSRETAEQFASENCSSCSKFNLSLFPEPATVPPHSEEPQPTAPLSAAAPEPADKNCRENGKVYIKSIQCGHALGRSSSSDCYCLLKI